MTRDDTIATIKYHKYRYGYEETTQKTRYRGPVGSSSPPITEQEFEKQIELHFRHGTLSFHQQGLVESYRFITEKHGKFNKDLSDRGAQYLTPSENMLKDKGVFCEHCIFYDEEEEERCVIVYGEIEPDARCKLWVIPSYFIKQ